jgi:hypothetical protein
MPVRGLGNFSPYNPGPDSKNTGHKPDVVELTDLSKRVLGPEKSEPPSLATRKVMSVESYSDTDVRVKNATEGVLSRSSSSPPDSPFSSPSASPRIDGDFKVPLYEAILSNASFKLNDCFSKGSWAADTDAKVKLQIKHNDAMNALKDPSKPPKDRYKDYISHLRDVLQIENINEGDANRYVGYAYNKLVTCGDVREPIKEGLDRLEVRTDAMDIQSDLPRKDSEDERMSSIALEVFDSPTESPRDTLSSKSISDLTGVAEERQSRLRGSWKKAFHTVVTYVRRVANNFFKWDQISLGNIPYRLGTLTMGDAKNSFQVEVLRHGSPLITSSLAGNSVSSVTPEFKAWVKTLPNDPKTERTALLYINRMKRNSGGEIARSAALRDFADSDEGQNMTMLTLPADGKYYTQEFEYKEDKDFSSLCSELVDRMVSKEDDSEFDIPDNVRQKLVANWKGTDPLATEYSDDDFKLMIESMFTEESQNYFSKQLEGRPLNRKERRALLVNFINGRFVDEVLKATQPLQYINSCKENVDRGAVGNAITAYRNGSSDSDTLSILYGAAAVSKRRVINHNVENFELWLQFRKPPGGERPPERFSLYQSPLERG